MTPTVKPLVLNRRIGTWWRISQEPDILGGKGKHNRHLWAVSDNATTPEGNNAAGSSSPEREREPSDAAIGIWSSVGAPKETVVYPVLPEGAGTPLREALTVILKSPLTARDKALPRVPGRTLDRGSLLCNSKMVMSHKENMHHPRKLPQHA